MKYCTEYEVIPVKTLTFSSSTTQIIFPEKGKKDFQSAG